MASDTIVNESILESKKMKHTPGPWKYAYDGHGGVSIDTEDGERQIGYVCYGDVDNAKLVAAAPDLLSALEILLADMEEEYRDRNGDADHDGMDKARAAIMKARDGDAE